MTQQIEKALQELRKQIGQAPTAVDTTTIVVVSLLADQLRDLEKRISSIEKSMEDEEGYRREQLERQ